MTHNIVSKDALVGTWKVIEAKEVDKEQKISYPYGKNPVGYIIFTQDGYMSVSIMMSNRLKLGLSLEEIQSRGKVATLKLITNIFKYVTSIVRYFQAGNKYAAYISKYEIRDNKLVYNIEVSIIPDLIGVSLERAFEISEDKLVLTTSYSGNNLYTTWQRVS